jgi:hypothetical protein
MAKYLLMSDRLGILFLCVAAGVFMLTSKKFGGSIHCHIGVICGFATQASSSLTPQTEQ